MYLADGAELPLAVLQVKGSHERGGDLALGADLELAQLLASGRLAKHQADVETLHIAERVLAKGGHEEHDRLDRLRKRLQVDAYVLII